MQMPRSTRLLPIALGALTSLALSAGCGAAPLLAQAAPAQPKGHEFSTNLSFVSTSGNTSVTTSGLDEQMILRPGWRWTHTQGFAVVYGRSNGAVAAEAYHAGWKTEMAFTARVGSYASLVFDRNRFAGIASQYIYSVGLSAQVLFAPNDQISIEAGLARVNLTGVNGTASNFFSGRTAGIYHHSFNARTSFDQVVELLPNLVDGRDLRVNSASSLVAPISSHFGLKASYLVRYDHEPQPGFKTTDATFTTGLQITY